MIKEAYTWFHRNISKPQEKEEPSGGHWHSRVRQEALSLCMGYKGRVLEAGCGEGLFVSALAISHPGLGIVGIDTNADKLARAKERCAVNRLNNVELLEADAAATPFDSDYFDGVVCINTFFNLQSIDMVDRVFAEITRVCKKSGRIIFDFRNSWNFLVRLKYALAPFYDPTVKKDGLPLNTYSPEKIKEILKKLDLKITTRKYIGFPGNILSPIVMMEAEKC